jgi:ArsR family metal-binding transcriptional regulator
MFVEYITLDHTRACLAEPGKRIVVGKPSRAIDAILPLLNAVLPNVITYNMSYLSSAFFRCPF